VLLVCFGLLFWLPAIKPFVHHQAWLWLYVANFAGLKGITFQPIFDHFWSLAVEEQFYFFWPLIVMLLPRKALIGLCVVMAIGSVTLRCALIGSNLLPDELAASLTPCRLDGLALGALVAAIARGPTGLLHLRWHAPWIAVVTFLVFAASKILVRSSGGIWGMLGIGLFATVVMLTAILVLAIEESSLAGRSFFVAPLRFFGKYSYGLYVYHFLIHPWLDVHFWYVRSMPFPSLILHILAASGTTMIIALASWHLYERHFLRLKKLFGHSHNPIQPKVELLPASSSKV
jgi:peptidoglycan/LPS O-acetylase OafA/YrhL